MRFYLLGGFGNLSFQSMIIQVLTKNRKVVLIDILINKNFFTKIVGWKIHENLSYLVFDKILFDNSSRVALTTFDLTCIYLSKITGRSFLNRMWIKDASELYGDYYAISGYFQDKLSFELSMPHINYLSKKLYSNITKTSCEVVIHYRGTDSNWAKRLNNYYMKIFNILASTTDVIVITDDLVRAKKNLPWCKDIRSGTLIQDLSILLGAKKIFCAPSTLSWWAALASIEVEEVYMPVMLQTLLPDVSKLKNVKYI